MIETFLNLIPQSQQNCSGSVFYSGKASFSAKSKLYILGLNPGGSPELQRDETISWHTRKVLEEYPPEWSAYSDESWNGAPPGTYRLQPRLLHMLRQLGLNPRLVPSSNVVFLRSARENTLTGDFKSHAELTWPFHNRVIQELGVKIILCFGHTAGNWIAQKISAHQVVGQFVEANKRKWKSIALTNSQGMIVVKATHPSRVDWTKPETDPSPLVRQCFESIN